MCKRMKLIDEPSSKDIMNGQDLTVEKVKELIKDFESEHIERTVTTRETDKFSEAICAFSNDLSNSARKGYLLIGVRDDGTLSGLQSDDRILLALGGLRSDGNILPQPILSINVYNFAQGDVIAIEVVPSPFPPVRYKGRVWIRVGP